MPRLAFYSMPSYAKRWWDGEKEHVWERASPLLDSPGCQMAVLAQTFFTVISSEEGLLLENKFPSSNDFCCYLSAQEVHRKASHRLRPPWRTEAPSRRTQLISQWIGPALQFSNLCAHGFCFCFTFQKWTTSSYKLIFLNSFKRWMMCSAVDTAQEALDSAGFTTILQQESGTRCASCWCVSWVSLWRRCKASASARKRFSLRIGTNLPFSRK